MKKLTLLMAMACFFMAGYGQYLPGERWVGTDEIPGLIRQLKNNLSASQKAFLLLDIGYGYLYKTKEIKEDLDSALFYARQVTEIGTRTNNVTIHQESLLLIAMIHMERKNFAAAESILPSMNDSMRLKILICLSQFNYYTFEAAFEDRAALDRAARYVQAALQLAIKTGMQKNMTVFALENIAYGYSELHLVGLAEKFFLLTLTCVDSKGYPSRARVYSNVSHVYTREGNFYQAMDYGIKARKALNSNSSNVDVAYVYLRQGSLYSVQNKPEQVLEHYAYLLEEPRKYAGGIEMYGVLASYCSNLQKLNRHEEVLPYVHKFQQRLPMETDVDRSFYHSTLANYYKDLKEFELAEKNFLAAIKYADTARIKTGALYNSLGVLYYQFNAYEKAAIALRAAEKKLPVEHYVVMASSLLSLAQVEAALGNHASAYDYLLRSKTLSDSIFTVGKARLSDELETQYETRKKEAALREQEKNIQLLNQDAELMKQEARLKDAKLTEASLLGQRNEIALQLKAKDVEILERNAKLQETAIEQANAKRKVTFLIMILMAVIAALLCWLFFTKLKSNKVITHKNELLQQLVKDKSWLLKEMHHRVKNNLHTIVSLLEFQSSYLHDDALEAIRHSQSRIFSMSLIHQKLYQTDDTKTIDMAAYIPELVDYLKKTFGIHRSVYISMDIDHAVFNVEEAVPLGLIINEVVTNSMKYAFKDNQPGSISISLKANGYDSYELAMADNGMGLSKDFDFDHATSLGFQLIKGLSEQLESTLYVTSENGLKITVSGISAYRTHKVKAMENELKEQMAI